MILIASQKKVLVHKVSKIECACMMKPQKAMGNCWRWRSLQANTPARALDAQKGCTQPVMQQECSVIGWTDLETDRADVELDLGWKGSRTTPERIRQGGACGGSLRPARPPKMPTNPWRKLLDSRRGWGEDIRAKIWTVLCFCRLDRWELNRSWSSHIYRGGWSYPSRKYLQDTFSKFSTSKIYQKLI
jgi:hypothetical protein